MVRIPLRLAENFPRINRVLPYVAAVMALAGFSTLFDMFVYVMPWVRAAQLLFSLLGAVAVIKNLRRGHANSGWIFLAYACYALPMMISAFRALGFYPVNVNFEMMTPAVLAYSLLLHFGILTELREQNAKRLVAEENAEIQRKLASQEERLRAEQTTFFAFVAHELRSPLGILLTGLANLRRALPSPDNAARIGRLGQAAQRMSALIESGPDRFRTGLRRRAARPARAERAACPATAPRCPQFSVCLPGSSFSAGVAGCGAGDPGAVQSSRQRGQIRLRGFADPARGRRR